MPLINAGKHGKYYVKENGKLFFYPQEWNKIIQMAKPRQRDSLTILINTGARHKEARHIKVEDVDYERNNLILRITKVRAKRGEKRPVPRHIPISSKFTKYLKGMIRRYKLWPEDYFPVLKHTALSSCIKRLSRQVGRKDWRDFSPHNVRKTTECWLIALGNDGFKVAKHLGHTAKVALNEYISPDIFTYDDKSMIRDILGDLYSWNERRF